MGAQSADRRDAEGQMALFNSDTHFVVYLAPRADQPTQELHGRESLAPGLRRAQRLPGDHH